MDVAGAVRIAAVRWLGAGSHPGGAALTTAVLDALPLRPGDLVVDVGTGTGRTLTLLRDRGVRAVGLDVEHRRLRAAGRRLASTHLASTGLARTRTPAVRPPPVRAVADAARLPLRTGTADVVLAECVVSTLPDPAAALAEAARVLRPGGALALTDVTLRPELGRVAPDVSATVLALTTPRPLEEWVALVREAGLEPRRAQEVPGAAAGTVRRVRRRLSPVTVVPAGRAALRTARAAQDAVAAGLLGYGVVVARAPEPAG